MALALLDPEGTVVRDRSQGSAHPRDAAIPEHSVSDHESNTAPVSRWVETYHQLSSLWCPDPAYALEPAPTGCNEGTRVATADDPAVLIAEAEAAGAGRSAVAVVSQVRPELLLVDLDGCADQVLLPLIAAATGTGAVLAYVAKSGSPDSRHVAFAVTPTGLRAHEAVRSTTLTEDQWLASRGL